jgi:hypothetical protein
MILNEHSLSHQKMGNPRTKPIRTWQHSMMMLLQVMKTTLVDVLLSSHDQKYKQGLELLAKMNKKMFKRTLRRSCKIKQMRMADSNLEKILHSPSSLTKNHHLSSHQQTRQKHLEKDSKMTPAPRTLEEKPSLLKTT